MTPGRLDIPGVRSSGISATFGLVAVVAVLLVAGAIVLSGDGLLSRGGSLGGGTAAGSPGAGDEGEPGATSDPAEPPTAPEGADPPAAGETEFSCEALSVRDPQRSRWRVANVQALPGEGYEQLKLSLERTGRRGESGTVRAEWLSPDEAVQRFQIPRPAGTRALALRFEGVVALDSDRAFDAAALEDLGVRIMRSVQVSSGPDGRTAAIVGVAGEGCARLSAPQWQRRGEDRRGDVLLDVQAP